MKELIESIRNNFSEAEDTVCQEKGIVIKLGSELKRNGVIINANKCNSIKKKQKEIEGYKKCDCIIISIYNNIIYLTIIELKTKTKIEDRFQERFLNCFKQFDKWFSKSYGEMGITYQFHFFCVYQKNSTHFIKFLKSINNRLSINGKKKTIEPIKSHSILSQIYKEYKLFIA